MTGGAAKPAKRRFALPAGKRILQLIFSFCRRNILNNQNRQTA
jgi:hypothetical protein